MLIEGRFHHIDCIYKFLHQKGRLNIINLHLSPFNYDNHKYNLIVLICQEYISYQFFFTFLQSMNIIMVKLLIIIIFLEFRLFYIFLISLLLISRLSSSYCHWIIFIFLFIRLIIIYLIHFSPVFYWIRLHFILVLYHYHNRIIYYVPLLMIQIQEVCLKITFLLILLDSSLNFKLIYLFFLLIQEYI